METMGTTSAKPPAYGAISASVCYPVATGDARGCTPPSGAHAETSAEPEVSHRASPSRGTARTATPIMSGCAATLDARG